MSIFCEVIKAVSQVVHSHQELGLINRDKVHSRLSGQEVLLGNRVGDSASEGQREKVLGRNPERIQLIVEVEEIFQRALQGCQLVIFVLRALIPAVEDLKVVLRVGALVNVSII